MIPEPYLITARPKPETLMRDLPTMADIAHFHTLLEAADEYKVYQEQTNGKKRQKRRRIKKGYSPSSSG